MFGEQTIFVTKIKIYKCMFSKTLLSSYYKKLAEFEIPFLKTWYDIYFDLRYF